MLRPIIRNLFPAWLAGMVIFLPLAAQQPPPKCGMAHRLETYAAATPAERALLKENRRAQQQGLTETYLSPSGHFLIYYETSGIDAIPDYDRNSDGTPDYLEFVAKAFDRAWEVEVDSLGFNPPPDENGDPLDVYQVYCESISFYGFTDFYNPIPGDPAGFYRFTSSITINTEFDFVDYPWVTDDPIVRDSLAIAVTAAHEFNHALQLGYRIWFKDNNINLFQLTDLWLLESSATYMEEVVAGQVNDYFYYLGCVLNSSDLNLTLNNSCGRIYGQVILFIMLGESYGRDFTRLLWEEIVEQPGMEALEALLDLGGSDISAELGRLATWVFFTGSNSVAGHFFPDAAGFPDPAVTVLPGASFENVPSLTLASDELPPLAYRLYELPVVATGNISASLAVSDDAALWSGRQLLTAEPYSKEFPAGIYFPLNYTPPLETIHLAVVSGNWNNTNLTGRAPYELLLSGQTSVAGVYPNPVRPDGDVSRVTFLNLPAEARVEIFSSNGLHLATVEAAGGGNVAFWDLTNHQGDPVGSGVYIYRIVSEERSEMGKIMVIR